MSEKKRNFAIVRNYLRGPFALPHGMMPATHKAEHWGVIAFGRRQVSSA